ncbi:MAG: ribosome recycling factor [Candidatus Pacebacteria bacterium]|nr:ribosome recycling factor [Candidatus Paceibacterota bacterium]
MAYSFTTFQNKTKETEQWLAKEFAGVRTGRATPTLLDGVQVESYGAKMPISSVATITTEDARTIRISPWDASNVVAIEKALLVSNLGVSAVVDEKGLRVLFPELTGERRTQLIKIVNQKLEDAKVAIRLEREKIWKDIQAKERDGELTEDERNRLKTEMEKIVQDAYKKLEELSAKKEKEIQS